MVKPNLVRLLSDTPVLTPLLMILIGQQLDDNQLIKLTHVIVNINKATTWPPIDIQGDKCGH